MSTVDPDARHTRKSPGARRDGYLAHVAACPETGEDYMTRRPNVERAVAEVATWWGRRLKLRYNWWTSFEPVRAQLGERFLWGFPVAGGGFEGSTLHAALLGEVKLGDPCGRAARRVERVSGLFRRCGLRVEVQPDILAWLWAHFAIEAGVIATAIKSGGVDRFLGSVDRIAEAVLAVRDARGGPGAGVNVDALPDAQMFAAPTLRRRRAREHFRCQVAMRFSLGNSRVSLLGCRCNRVPSDGDPNAYTAQRMPALPGWPGR